MFLTTHPVIRGCECGLIDRKWFDCDVVIQDVRREEHIVR